MPSKDARIIIVGAGVFGLSTALHLAKAGYTKITLFDRCDFDTNHYDPANGCDGASADINKIFRAAYGKKNVYQSLALEAREIWLQWNRVIKASSVDELPEPLTPEDELLVQCGVLYLGDGPEMSEHYAESLKSLERVPDFRCQQFVRGNHEDEARLSELGERWHRKLHVTDRVMGGDTHGFLDTSGGIALADKACTFAKHLCSQLGVRFVLGRPHGEFARLTFDPHSATNRVTGIQTRDDRHHAAELVILACGSWTASVLPEAHRTVEATTGSVLFMDIPKEREDLREKFLPENYPVWHFRRGRMGDDDYYEGGGFPITREGRLKFGFRGRKLTNFQPHPTHPNLRISTPWTRYTDNNACQTVPLYNLELQKQVIGEAFPELAEIGFTDSRLCWYTDSIDNDFVIDYVPGYSDSLFLCTGGSGHGFKFLPILGKYVLNQIERTPSPFTSLWKWRVAEPGQIANGLEMGEDRDIKGVRLAERKAFQFEPRTNPMKAVDAVEGKIAGLERASL